MNAFNLNQWIEENRHLLKPPVGNKCVFANGTFIIMAVGGPNLRTDFHINTSDEFFHQLKGDIFLRILNAAGEIEEIPIKEGEVFLLPGGVPHSPQRAADSIGLVVEKMRALGERDGLRWYCHNCHHQLYEEFFQLENIETQFPSVFDRYHSGGHGKCPQCGHMNGKEWK